MTVLTDDEPVSSHAENAGASSGVLLIDKPSGITSHDAVDLVRRVYKTRRVGHAGTLDPMASGLMLIMVGAATKISRYLTGLDKSYTATIRLGWISSTGDAEGDLQPLGEAGSLMAQEVQDAVAAHQGPFTQSIPAYAAKRTDGKRRYEMARAGDDVPEMTQDVTIHSIELCEWNAPDAVVHVHCSSGTYIRSLAESIGQAVNCGGYLTTLRRDAIGPWGVEDACTVDELPRASLPRPIDEFLTYPRLVLDEENIRLIQHGTPILRTHVDRIDGAFSIGDIVTVNNKGGRVLAIGRTRADSEQWNTLPVDDAVFRYERVLI